MNQNDELYHYGVPGMKWGVKKTASKTSSSYKSRSTETKQKPKLSKKAKIAIGATAAGVALAGIGTVLAKDVIQKAYITGVLAKAFRDAM